MDVLSYPHNRGFTPLINRRSPNLRGHALLHLKVENGRVKDVAVLISVDVLSYVERGVKLAGREMSQS